MQTEHLSIKGLDYIELYVANAFQFVYFLKQGFGFNIIGYKEKASDSYDEVSYILEQGNIHLIITSAVTPSHFVSQHVYSHGDAVKDIAFEVEDAEYAFETAIKHGATVIRSPDYIQDKNGKIIKASVLTFGSTIHSFIQRDQTNIFYLPFYEMAQDSRDLGVGLNNIDHIAIALDYSTLDTWRKFYGTVFSFSVVQEEIVDTNNSGMNSIVMATKDNSIKFVFVEPRKGKIESQVETFIKKNKGPGVQHIAFHSNDIYKSMQALRNNGIEFLHIPQTYYEHLEERVNNIHDKLKDLNKLKILVDQDEKGHLFQAFTKPIHQRPTLFFEIIQRMGSEGFGKGNIRALFEAIEREQGQKGKNLE
ncbi:MAG: 4-hydroxyphenylpyruvate dioxygenase [Proteobacteria bacterium]|nr:4-hydroxyphenylpyruvate dioxygenase [Pseudomonadota bacterium]